MPEGVAVSRTRSRDHAPPSPGDSLVRRDSPAASADVRRRVTRLLLLRTLVITMVLGLSLWLLLRGETPARGAVWLQSAIIAATYLSAIVFGVAMRRGVDAGAVARPMLGTDLALTSALVYATGGAESPYAFLFALTIVAAGAISYRRGAVTVTGAALGAQIVIGLLAWGRVLPVPVTSSVHPWDQTAPELVRSLGIGVAALIGVGALSYIFGEQLERGAETLATTRRAAADLLSLHQDIVRSLGSGLITTTPDGTVLTANAAAAEILGRDHATLPGMPIEAVMPGLTAVVAQAPHEAHRADLEIPGEARPVAIGATVSPLRDVRDQEIGRIVHFQDLTELRRLEQDARRAERLASVGRLAAGVAHEIRNPLAAISGSIELLRQAPSASDDDRTLMAIVHREIQRLNVLIGDLLDYASPKPSQRIEVDLAEIVEETVLVARGDKAFADITLAAEVARPLTVRADPAKLRQVVWNLVRNAAEAARDGGKHVRVEARRADDRVQLDVGDDGPGMDQATVARVFEPFFTTKSKGTGLGLATCHAVIAEHGGRIDVETRVGKGTNMVVSLPWAG